MELQPMTNGNEYATARESQMKDTSQMRDLTQNFVDAALFAANVNQLMNVYKLDEENLRSKECVIRTILMVLLISSLALQVNLA